MRKSFSIVLAVLIVLSIVLSACAPQATPTAAPAEPEATAPAASEVPAEPEGETPAETEAAAEPAKELKVAAIFPGVITDADYNTLAYLGLTAVQTNMGIETAYSETVAVPDVDRVMREYIDAGFNVIWTHGGQFVTQTTDLAKAFPEIVFIAEGDNPIENPPANLWVIDRNFHTGFYAIGALAAKITQTGKIGYVAGQTLPFSYAEAHAIQQALADLGSDVEFKYVWAGDFNDPTKARQVSDAMMAEGVDVLIGSFNLGMFGVFEAVKANTDSKVLVTAKYADKTTYAPDNYVTALLYDFEKPLTDIVTAIQNGETGGYYVLGFDTGVAVQMPLRNVDPSVQAEVEEIIEKIKSGEITVVKDTSPLE
ncbi:MAG TPA: BMP family protein [Anaerolineaceae bacterium]|nr:BMP family protein [Anaerolineaceae bacterium]